MDFAFVRSWEMRSDHLIKQSDAKALFGCNGSVPLGDRFLCENDLLSVSKRSFVWDNGTAPSQPNRAQGTKLVPYRGDLVFFTWNYLGPALPEKQMCLKSKK